MGIGENIGCNIGENTGSSGALIVDDEPPPGVLAEVTANFQAFSLGQVVTGTDGFSLAGTQSVADNTRSTTGTQSCKGTLSAGSNGQAQWGGYFNQAPLLPVSVGETLTYQLDMWIDSAWDWKTGSKGPFRIQLKNSVGSSYGYFDLICDEGGGGVNRIRPEFSVGLPTVDTALFSLGQWITVKTEIVLSNVVGEGSWKVWYDDSLEYDASSGYRTCFNATDQITGIHCFAFFNEDTPDSDQYMWFDNFKITRS